MDLGYAQGRGRGRGVYVCDSFSHGGQPHVVWFVIGVVAAVALLALLVIVAIAEQHALFSPAVPRRCPRDTSEDRGRKTEKDEIAPVLARRTRDPSGAVTAPFRATEFQSSYSISRLAGHGRTPPLAVSSSTRRRVRPAAGNR